MNDAAQVERVLRAALRVVRRTMDSTPKYAASSPEEAKRKEKRFRSLAEVERFLGKQLGGARKADANGKTYAAWIVGGDNVRYNFGTTTGGWYVRPQAAPRYSSMPNVMGGVSPVVPLRR